MIEDQVKETTENQNHLNRLGGYGIEGGPGRPKGVKNKFTLIRRDLLEVWEEENGKERFRELFNGSKKDFLKALEKIIAILPKEPVTASNEEKGEVTISVVTTCENGDTKTEEIGF